MSSFGITDITPFTTQDYPNKTACILWFGGCNMRCRYCHNPELVNNKKYNLLSFEKIEEFLRSRVDLLDGVVLSGGECTLDQEYFKEIVLLVKKFNFLLKIDTNATNSSILIDLISSNKIDMVAVDYKAPKEKFKLITNVENNLFDKFHDGLINLIALNVNLEIRTTIHSALLDENDINCIIEDLEKIKFRYTYYLQKFNKNEKNILSESLLLLEDKGLNLNLIKKSNTFKINFERYFN